MQLISSKSLTTVLGVAAAALSAAPIHAARHHATSHAHHPVAPRRSAHHEKMNAPTAPHGVTTVPAGGLKVYCARHGPLLVRKMTQGAGTTVTVICR